jgi:hypothetical protein
VDGCGEVWEALTYDEHPESVHLQIEDEIVAVESAGPERLVQPV